MPEPKPEPVTVSLANDLPGLIEAATKNLEDNWKSPFADGAPRQLPIILGQAQATLALAIAQTRTADAAELGNMIAARHMGIYNNPAEYRAVENKLRELLGLEGPRHD
jgi:hypothetical protein